MSRSAEKSIDRIKYYYLVFEFCFFLCPLLYFSGSILIIVNFLPAFSFFRWIFLLPASYHPPCLSHGEEEKVDGEQEESEEGKEEEQQLHPFIISFPQRRRRKIECTYICSSSSRLPYLAQFQKLLSAGGSFFSSSPLVFHHFSFFTFHKTPSSCCVCEIH